jgi:hypothetical protein
MREKETDSQSIDHGRTDMQSGHIKHIAYLTSLRANLAHLLKKYAQKYFSPNKSG